MARKYPLSDVGCDSDTLNVILILLVKYHGIPIPARRMHVNWHVIHMMTTVMSTEFSLDVDSDISSSLEQIKSDDDIDQKDMNHTSCAVSQSDDDFMLITS